MMLFRPTSTLCTATYLESLFFPQQYGRAFTTALRFNSVDEMPSSLSTATNSELCILQARLYKLLTEAQDQLKRERFDERIMDVEHTGSGQAAHHSQNNDDLLPPRSPEKQDQCRDQKGLA